MSIEYAFFIVGLPDSGKALVANILAHKLGVKHAGSSSIVYDELARERGVARWELEATPTEIITPELERVGDLLCMANPAALVAPLLRRGVRVVHGIRRRAELAAARAEAMTQGMRPVVVWMERRGSAVDNTEITVEDADYVIHNAGCTIGHLAKQVSNLAGEFSATHSSCTPLLDSLPDLDDDTDPRGRGLGEGPWDVGPADV